VQVPICIILTEQWCCRYSPKNQLSAVAVRWPESNSGTAGFVESIEGLFCCGCGGRADDASEREKPPVRWVKLLAPGNGAMASDDDNDEHRGELELAMELLPVELAVKRPAGDGRSDPNQYPSLPEPDRTSMLALANPLTALRSLVGPGVVKLLLCVRLGTRCICRLCLRSNLSRQHIILALTEALCDPALDFPLVCPAQAACCAMLALMFPLILSHVISAKIDAMTGG
jgi:hypothetical protein